MTHLCTSDLEREVFASIWEQARVPQESHVWVEWDRFQPSKLPPSQEMGSSSGPRAGYLGSAVDVASLPLETSIQGRIFWSDGELRWRRLRLPYCVTTWRVVYLGEADVIVDLLETRELPDELEGPKDGLCIELQGGHSVFGRSLPPTNRHRSGRLEIQLKRYQHRNTGVTLFERFGSIKIS